jgi:uncharacterized membrane protein
MTGLSRFALLVLVYYLSADIFLIDGPVLDLTSQMQGLNDPMAGHPAQ